MQKKEEFKIEDSNVAGIGSTLDKDARKAAAATETAWKTAGKKPGLQVWRIEKFEIKKSKTPVGQFYDDDSYIVLNTYQCKDIKGNLTEKLGWDVHFWLGRTTSQDEYGTAAYKTVELDDFLGGGPVQHRECSGFESSLFLSYFTEIGGIQLLEGGIESGFNRVKPEEFSPRLLHLKGRKNIRVQQVTKELASLNSGDVFILDLGLTIIQWQGKSAGKNEKARAGQLCRQIDDERNGKPEVIVTGQRDSDAFDEFYQHLGAASLEEAEASIPEGGSDSEWETKQAPKLFKLSDATGEIKFEEVELKDGKASIELFTDDDAYIFDVGAEVFVWVGKGASEEENAQGLNFAQQYLKNNGKNAKLPVSKVSQGNEGSVFKAALRG